LAFVKGAGHYSGDFYDHCKIVEQNTAAAFFENPTSERTRDFPSKILGH
jgi:ABC-type polar amino acid transport system ATPase subunit